MAVAYGTRLPITVRREPDTCRENARQRGQSIDKIKGTNPAWKRRLVNGAGKQRLETPLGNGDQNAPGERRLLNDADQRC